MEAPIIYVKDAFKDNLANEFNTYWNELPWEDRGVPRIECFLSKNAPINYSYGVEAYARTYTSKNIPKFMLEFWKAAEEFSNCDFELCFCNGYADERNHLGWHADDSDSVDDGRPILVVSIGAERDIMFRDRERTFTERMKLENCSGLLMTAGMQDTHDHRVPKCDRKCGPRISFTFRGLAK